MSGSLCSLLGKGYVLVHCISLCLFNFTWKYWRKHFFAFHGARKRCTYLPVYLYWSCSQRARWMSHVCFQYNLFSICISEIWNMQSTTCLSAVTIPMSNMWYSNTDMGFCAHFSKATFVGPMLSYSASIYPSLLSSPPFFFSAVFVRLLVLLALQCHSWLFESGEKKADCHASWWDAPSILLEMFFPMYSLLRKVTVLLYVVCLVCSCKVVLIFFISTILRYITERFSINHFC